MKKQGKRVLSLFLTVCLLLSTAGLSAFATTNAPAVSLADTSVTVSENDAATGKADIVVSDNDGGFSLLTVHIYYRDSVFDMDKVNVLKTADDLGYTIWKTSVVDENTDGEYEAYVTRKTDDPAVPSSYATDGYKMLTIEFETDIPGGIAGDGVLAHIEFTVAAGTEAGDYDLEIEVIAEDADGTPVDCGTTDGTCSVTGILPTIAGIELSESSVTVDGYDGDTVYATVTSAQGNDITDIVTLSVAPSGQGVSLSASADGVIEVDEKAEEGTYTVTASALSGETQGEDVSDTFSVSREAAELTYVSVSGGQTSIDVPTVATGGTASTTAFTAAAYDQYDEPYDEDVFVWSVDSVTGVSIDQSGVVTVTSAAAGGSVTVTASVYGQDNIYGTATLTIKKNTPAPVSVTVSGGQSTAAVPTAAAGGTLDMTAFTASATDQYGGTISTQSYTWKVTKQGSDTCTGVSVSGGIVTVTSSASAGTYTVTATATGTSIAGNKTFTLTKAAPVVTTVKIGGGPSGALTVPDKTATEALTATPYTATVYDQFGETMSGQTIQWTILNGSSAVTGVAIAGGTVSVAKTAKTAVTDTTGLTLTVTASCNGASDTESLTVKRATPVLSSVTVGGGVATFAVPTKAVNKANTTAFTATAYDQYETAMSGKTFTWSITSATGVSIDQTGLVTIDYTASAGILSVQATVQSEGVFGGKSFSLTKAEPVATTVEISGGSTAYIGIPTTGSSSDSYSATVYDQFGDPMNETPTWSQGSVSPNLSVSGSTVTVTAAAADNACAVLTASSPSNPSLTDTITVYAKKAVVDWSGISANSSMTYGDTCASAFTSLPTTGTVKAYVDGAETTLTGTFSLLTQDYLPAGSGRQITVQFKVTTADNAYTNSVFVKNYTVNVAPKSVAVSWGESAFTYDKTEKKPTASVASDLLVGSDTLTVSVAGGQISAGTYTAVASAANANYTLTGYTKEFTIGRRAVTVSGIAVNGKVYDGTTAVAPTDVVYTGVTFGNIVSGDTLTVTANAVYGSDSVGTDKTVNLSNLTLGGTSVGNYVLATTGQQTTATATVSPKEVSLNWSGYATRTYDGTASAVTATAAGLIAGDNCSVTVTGGTEKNAGTHTATATALGNANYCLPQTGSAQSYTIDRAEYDMSGVTFTDESYVYDGRTHTRTVSGTLPTGADGVKVTVTYDGGATHVSDGEQTVTATFGTTSGNYNAPTAMTAKVSVTPKPVTVSWSATDSFTYNALPQAPTPSLKATDILSGESLTPIVGGKETNCGNAYTATVSFANSDYVPSGTPSKAYAIVPKNLTVNGVTAEDRRYEAGNTAVTLTGGTLVGVEVSDLSKVSLVLGTGTLADDLVGVDKPVATAITLSGSAAGNYTLTQPTLTVNVFICEVEQSATTQIVMTDATGDGNAKYALFAKLASDRPTAVSGYGKAANRVASDIAIHAAANSVAANRLLAAGIIAPDETPDIRLVVCPHFVFSVKNANNLAGEPNMVDSFTLDIHPEFRLVATIAAAGDEIVLSGANQNAVIINTYTEDMREPVTLRVSIPDSFVSALAEKKVYVTHKGTTQITEAQGEAGHYCVTFVNSDGFSEFVFGSRSDVSYAARIGSALYTSLASAVASVRDGETVTLLKNCSETVTVSREVRFTLNCAPYAFTGTIKAGSGYRNAGSAYSYVFRTATDDPGETEGGGDHGGGGGSSSGGGSSAKEPNLPAVNTEKKTPFTDVPAGSYFEDATAWAVAEKVTNGMTATFFGASEICTRAQVVTFLWRAAGSPRVDGAKFSDVAADTYYAPAVVWAVANGITKGTTATTFSPNATCTRAQIITFLARYAGADGAVQGTQFRDVSPNAYYASAVAWAVANGITGGTTADTFSPNRGCTRAQVVTFLYRYAG